MVQSQKNVSFIFAENIIIYFFAHEAFAVCLPFDKLNKYVSTFVQLVDYSILVLEFAKWTLRFGGLLEFV